VGDLAYLLRTRALVYRSPVPQRHRGGRQPAEEKKKSRRAEDLRRRQDLGLGIGPGLTCESGTPEHMAR
jgi:hypothetical protein